MTVCIETKEAWRSIQNQLGDLRIGLVATMGALHEGHRSLLERSVRENDITVLTVFVNPTQFNESQDLEAYPRRLEEDLQIAQACGVHYLFAPSVEEMYGANEHFRMTEHHFSHGMEGAHRPGHFDGVLTIVLKLLNLIPADRAYFGEKDYMQYQLVSEMAKAFFLKTEIVPCPIVRAASGLALSSRNLNLSPEELDRAPEL
jgi:pantoate--beta-alanine ligase